MPHVIDLISEYLGEPVPGNGLVKIFYNVRDYGLKGDGHTDDSGALAALVAKLSNQEATLLFPPGSYFMGNDVTVPDNLAMYFVKGASLKPDSGKTVSINGAIEAEPYYHIFDMSLGGLIGGTPQIASINPYWFGAVGDGVADDTQAVQLALDMAADSVQALEVFDGTYRFTKKGTFKNSWTNTFLPYALMLTGKSGFNITVHSALFVMDVSGTTGNASTTTSANFLVLQDCSDVTISGWSVQGQGRIPVHVLYDVAGVHLDGCNRIRVDYPKMVDARHNVVAFKSRDITVRDAWTKRSAVPFIMGGVNGDFPVADPDLLSKMGTHVGMYASANTLVDGCKSYGSCEDGDLGAFGGGCRNNIFSNNQLYNYFEEDTEKKNVNIVGQGLYIDSGVVKAVVSNNTVLGYYYGIDVKTEVQDCAVVNNQASDCMVCIAARRGEGNLPINTVLIANNIITPNHGNGWEQRMARSFDPDSREYVQSPVGIWIQDCQGGSITGNQISNDYNDTLQTWNFVGIYVSNTRTFNLHGKAYCAELVIEGNSFFCEQRMFDSGKAGISNREAIIIAGYEGDNIPDATTAPTFAASSGGTLAAGTYIVTYAWYNDYGTTLDTATTNTTTIASPNQTLTITIPAKPDNATGARIYMGLSASTLHEQGTTTTTTFVRSTPISTTGSAPLGLNTTSFSPVTNVTIANNGTDNNWTNVSTAYPNGFFRFQYVQQLVIDNHSFVDVVVSGTPWFTFLRCTDIVISNITWRYNQGLARFTSCLGVTITGTSSWESTAGTSRAYWTFIDTSIVQIIGNKMRRSGASLADGYWVAVSGTSDVFIITNNVIQPINYNPVNPLPASFYSGTIDTTTTPIKNIIENNVFLLPSITWPKFF